MRVRLIPSSCIPFLSLSRLQLAEHLVIHSGAIIQALYKIGFAKAGLQIGQSAFLWNLFAKPRLLYGAETWSVSSKKGWQDLESAQLQGARRIFGKKANYSKVGEALRGDLGWLSVESQAALAKLSFYGHLCRLPDSHLLKKILLYRKAQYEGLCQRLHVARLTDGSWYSEICEIARGLNMGPIDLNVLRVGGITKRAWKIQIQESITRVDTTKLFADFLRTQSGIHYAQIKQEPGQERYIWRHDRRSTVLNFALRSGSYRLQARIHKKGPVLESDKVCRLCYSEELETEEHFLLSCSAFYHERLAFCDTLTHNMANAFPMEYAEISQATGTLQMRYLSGRTEEHWAEAVPLFIDRLIRPYLLALEGQRKWLLKDLDQNVSFHSNIQVSLW
jgi:hypothetical protein